jgi:hypothetical protein
MGGIISQSRWPGVFDPASAHRESESKRPISRPFFDKDYFASIALMIRLKDGRDFAGLFP